MSEKILIVDDDVDTLRLVGLMLQRQGYQITAATSGQQALEKAFEERPDVILLDVMMPDMDGYELTRRLRKNPVSSTTPILLFTAKTQLDDKVAGFEAGADDYLTKPTHPAELQAHIRALLVRVRTQKPEEIEAPVPEQQARVIGVLAARGSQGTSTLACNLAGAFYTRTHADVILAELRPGQGTLGMDLGTPNPAGLNELLCGKPVEVTREKVESLLVSHGSGLRLMLASENPRDVYLINQVENYPPLVNALATLARYVVLDLGSGLPPFVEKLLPLCTERIVVLEGSPNVITQTRMLIAELAALHIDPAALTIVLNNRMRTETQMPWMEVQQALGYPIAAALTPAPEMFNAATHMRTPAVLAQPTNLTSQQILKVADLVLEREKVK